MTSKLSGKSHMTKHQVLKEVLAEIDNLEDRGQEPSYYAGIWTAKLAVYRIFAADAKIDADADDWIERVKAAFEAEKKSAGDV